MENQKSLSHYKVQNNSKIILMIRSSEHSFSFSSLQNSVELEFGDISEPSYRKVSPGLTLFTICRTHQCQAFNKQVCIQKGFGTFNICQKIQECFCPVCKEPARELTNFGYYQTFITIQGLQKNGKKILKKDTASKKKFMSFRKTDEELQDWLWLNLTVIPQSYMSDKYSFGDKIN